MKRTAMYLALSSLVASPSVLANTNQAAMEEMRAQIAALTARLNELESKTAMPVAVSGKQAKSSWEDKISFSGDFRYRYETIDDERKDDDRNRNRLRARIGMKAKVTDNITFGLGLASGSDDPVSTNQSLGKSASTKGFGLDMAYMDWKFAENTHLVAGKTKNLFYAPAKNGLIWDGDYRPEGIALTYNNGSFFGTAAYHFLESDNKAGDQDAEEMYGAQIGFNTKLGDETKLTVGAGYFYIPVAGSTPFFDDDSFGNSLAVDDTYAFDYEEVEVFAELKTSLGDMPLTLFADYVQNQDADDEDTGYAVGVKLGKAKNPGSWEFGYTFQDLEADAVFATFSDSDFGGGGTDVQGHLLKAAYAFEKGTTISATYFINEYGEFTRGEEFDYDRLQMDVKFKF